jgi:nitrogen regulatory protein PII
MKQVQAILRPEKLDAVKDVLVDLGIQGMTVIPVEGFGNQLGHTEVYRGVKVEARFVRKVLVMLVVKDSMLPALIDAIRSSAATGEVGDGKIVVTDVVDVVRIRTGERGEVSLG